MTRGLLVMMEALPGAGKTTLATGLVAHLRRLGHTVDHVPEEAIFTRTEFAEVGDAFKTKVFPTPELMLAAYRRIFTAALATGAHVVADWNALGMIEDLPCAQPDRTSATSNDPDAVADMDVLVAHARDVRNAWRGHTMLLVLEVAVAQAVERAANQRGPEWIRRQTGRWNSADTEPSLEAVVRGHDAYGHRRQAIIQAHRRAGWDVRRVDARRTAAAVLDHVTDIVQQHDQQP